MRRRFLRGGEVEVLVVEDNCFGIHRRAVAGIYEVDPHLARDGLPEIAGFVREGVFHIHMEDQLRGAAGEFDDHRPGFVLRGGSKTDQARNVPVVIGIHHEGGLLLVEIRRNGKRKQFVHRRDVDLTRIVDQDIEVSLTSQRLISADAGVEPVGISGIINFCKLVDGQTAGFDGGAVRVGIGKEEVVHVFDRVLGANTGNRAAVIDSDLGAHLFGYEAEREFVAFLVPVKGFPRAGNAGGQDRCQNGNMCDDSFHDFSCKLVVV